jgi:hypothetical protein
MKEDLIQFIWRSKFIYSKNPLTTTGETIEILHTGHQNTNQGPDFLFAKIKINDILWVGHVEIHVKSSDWLLHQHEHDPNYQNTILHVVWDHDNEISWSGRKISCLELKSLIRPEILINYQQLMENRQRIPCQRFIENISPLIKASQIERMMMERMEEKTNHCKVLLSGLQWDWEAILFNRIAHYIVAPVNCEAMDRLCQKLPYPIITKVYHNAFSLSALFFGTAGFLNETMDHSYSLALQTEYHFLKAKFDLSPMEAFEWKLLRLRPAHFPTLRIAQLTSILAKHQRLFSKILEGNGIVQLLGLLDADPDEYWREHYTFSKKAVKCRIPAIGKQTKELIIINAICPILFAYGSIYQLNTCMDRAINYLERMKPEINHISHMWKNFNFVFDHAGHSQGGIQLFQRYCTEKKCTSCSIGNEILKNPFYQ